MNTYRISKVSTSILHLSVYIPLTPARLRVTLPCLQLRSLAEIQLLSSFSRVSKTELWNCSPRSIRGLSSTSQETSRPLTKGGTGKDEPKNIHNLGSSIVWDSYDANEATEVLFKECARQADYIIPQAFERSGKIPKSPEGEDIGEGVGCWYEYFGLVPTFANWAQVTMLHMYLLTARIRYFPPQHATKWMQLLHDHFFYEAEHRMNLFHNISSRMVRNRHLKDLYNQWRGVQGAYDEGLVKGDAVLGAAVWRNVFKADRQTSWKKIALIVSFMRRGLQRLDKANDGTILTASLQFGNPMQELSIVQRTSPQKAFSFSEHSGRKASSP